MAMETENIVTDDQTRILEKNLCALASRRPKLVQRICWPIDGRHVEWKEDIPFYKLGSSSYPLQLGENEIVQLNDDLTGNHDVFVFGLGLGEHVDYLLDQPNLNKVEVWDRDPWFVRDYLMSRDVSDALVSGRLEIGMCGDIIYSVRKGLKDNVVYHPLLRELYSNERELLKTGIGTRRVLVNAEGLYVDDVAVSLRNRGFSTFYLSMNRISIEEIEHAIVQYLPSIVFSVNYYTGLAELCEKFGLQLICWEIDPCLDAVEQSQAASERNHIFTFRKKNVESFKKAGFQNSYYLPLAANCESRKPVCLAPEEKLKYECRVSFVGTSMVGNSHKFRNKFRDLFTEFLNNGLVGFSKGEKLFAEILEHQRKDFSHYVIPEVSRGLCGDFLEYAESLEHTKDSPIAFVGEVAASEKRITYISKLGTFGLRVWGDEGWTTTEETGVRYMGYAGHKYELNKIYSGSIINVDVNRLYQPDIVTMRTFDIMACGGFVLAEYSEDLEELFEIDREVAAYGTLEELLEKVEYYLAHPQERQEIARAGMMAVRERHSVENRVQDMLRIADLA